MALWFGFICFAIITFKSIGGEAVSAYSSAYYAPTTLNIALIERQLALNNTQIADTEQSLEIPLTVLGLFQTYPVKPAVIERLSYFK